MVKPKLPPINNNAQSVEYVLKRFKKHKKDNFNDLRNFINFFEQKDNIRNAINLVIEYTKKLIIGEEEKELIHFRISTKNIDLFLSMLKKQNKNIGTAGEKMLHIRKIIKEKSGFYSIKDYSNETVIEKINLPQTAAILANGLALGKWLDNEIVSIDRHYGYSLFQETLTKQGAQKSLLRKDVDRADLLFTKSSIARTKKLIARQQIYDRFEKLRRLR
jgi:hypothetical protein